MVSWGGVWVIFGFVDAGIVVVVLVVCVSGCLVGGGFEWLGFRVADYGWLAVLCGVGSFVKYGLAWLTACVDVVCAVVLLGFVGSGC